MKRAMFLGAAMMVAASQAWAVSSRDFDLYSAQDLVNLCSVKASDRNHEQAIGGCLGFIEGVAQFHEVAVRARRFRPVYCIPKGVTVTKAQAVAVYLAWASANKRYMEKSALEGLLRAAAEKWPCVRNHGR